MPAQLLSIPGLDFLTRRDLTLTSTAGTGAVETVAEFSIPRGQARKFLPVNGRLTLGAKDTFSGDGVATEFTLAQPISNNPRAFPIPAKLSIGGVYKTYTSNPAPGAGEFTVLFATNKVKTGDVAPAVANNVVVYYPPVNGDGEFTIEVFSPNDRHHETYGNGSIRSINTMPQDDINSPWRMNETPWLVQDYVLRVQVRSASDVNVDAANPYTVFELPFVRKPIQQVTKEEYQQLVASIGA